MHPAGGASELARAFMAAAALLVPVIQLTAALGFTSLQMPALVQRGSNFWLACQFELEQPQENLYSVKWYKNNEEFYRIIWSPWTGGGGGVAAPLEARSGSADWEPLQSSASPASPAWPKLQLQAQPQQLVGEQQYFSQSGVNVMMSSSNATHVRLLNASLESEGLYACEISTQNLSTIRYENEIRVYVLSGARPSIIGFRPRYAIGDQVDLICATDFSKPRPVLAWFINGRRIAQSGDLFQLEPLQARAEPPEAGLDSQQLGLKFRLSNELLAFLQPGAGERAPAIKIQCKYRLVEVSQVAFNELLLADAQSALAGDPPALNSGEPAIRVRREPTSNQVSQSRLAASTRELLGAVAGPLCPAAGARLAQEDPLLTGNWSRASARRLLLDCWTAGSLLPQQPPQQQQPQQQLRALPSGSQSPARTPTGCLAEPEERRRALVSGRPLTAPATPNQRSTRPSLAGAGQVAYLSLTPGHNWTAQADKWPGAAAADSAPLSLPAGRTGDELTSERTAPPPPPPPMLEWFINNQEAPKHSVRYEPSLARSGFRSDSAQAPSAIDYQDYFANFDARPLHQRLALELDLDELELAAAAAPRAADKDKTQPGDASRDSSIRLRCSSTQAQFLASDSVSVTIVPLQAGGARRPTQLEPGANQQQHQQHRYNKRRPSRNGQSSKGAAASTARPKACHLIAVAAFLLACHLSLVRLGRDALQAVEF